MNIEQRMMEQKQRKAAEQKKRVQGRQAFKAQLELNAPARKYVFIRILQGCGSRAGGRKVKNEGTLMQIR